MLIYLSVVSQDSNVLLEDKKERYVVYIHVR